MSKNLTRKRVLISGGGLAGPAIATLLARDGADVTVIEIADGVRPGGQAVDIRGAGRVVLNRMGLLDRARATGLRQQGIADVDCRGCRRTEMTVDLVIGADGPHSATRRLAFGPEDTFVRPLGGYMAWFTAPERASLDGWYQMYNAPGGLVASLRPGREPGVAKASLSFASGPLAYDRHDLEAQRRLLQDRFEGLGWRVPDLLRAAASADDFYLDALVQVHMGNWTLGRIALVGDAAYCPSPLTGLGTSLALVGAYVLAGELAAHPDHRSAFAGYERVVRPYVDTGQKLPPGGIRAYAPQSQRAISARWMSTRLMASRPLRGLTRRLFFSKAGAIDLPEYGSAAVR